ncbi:hypothetical protein FHS14_001504 [Paenibacillus baekrokdamisoli]|nr:hypothetical protein [Paenibacillus baekrokdamisoli]
MKITLGVTLICFLAVFCFLNLPVDAAVGSRTITFKNSTGISGSTVTDGQGGSADIANIVIQISPVDVSGHIPSGSSMEYHDMTDAWGVPPMVAPPNGSYGISIKSSSSSINFSMSSLDFNDWGDWDGGTFNIQAYSNGSPVGAPVSFIGNTNEDYVHADLSSNANFKNIDEARIYRPIPVSTFSWIGINNIAIVVAPTAATSAASGISPTGATLNGTVDDNGTDTTVSFEYGTTASYGTTTAATTGGTIAAGSGSTPASLSLSSLLSNTTYHYRVKAVNNVGTTTGSDQTFTTLPAPAHTAAASAATSTPVVGVNDAITLTVKNSLGNTDTTFNGPKNVAISGYTVAPDGSYGSFNGAALTASPNTISVTFTNGVATANLKLNKASIQMIGFNITGVTTPATNTLSITPAAGSASSMALTTALTAPASNGSVFAQQPVITLRDTYGNTSSGDNSTVITASKKDAGSWTLAGTMTATASSGVVTFTSLKAANTASVSGAQLAFDAAGLAQVTSSTVTLPAPAPAQTAGASAAALTPITGVNDAITLTVKNSLGNTDTTFSGVYDVTISGYTQAPDGSYGSFNGTTLTVSPNTISVTFTNGVATANLKLNKASLQTIGFSIAGVATSAANTLSITPVAGSASSMELTTDLTAPTSNGGMFAQQPVITLLDAYENTSVGDSTTEITVSKKDAGSWTLAGTMTATASSGVVTFTSLKAANTASVSGAQLAFDAAGLAQVTSSTVTLPAPAPAQTAGASAAALTPITGVNDAITLTVKNSLGNTDTTFSGIYDVTISGYTQAPDGSYGSFNGTTLTVSPNTISVTFTNGVATANLKLNKASLQTIGISIDGVATPATNTISITPVAGIASSMKLTTDLTAPASNGGVFAQQPVITLRDTYGNTSVGDITTVITVSKKDAGSWTLTGTMTATASSGIATFTDLGTANTASVSGAQLAFDTAGLTPLTSSTVTLPAPAPAQTAGASAAALTPITGVNDAITLTVKNSLGNTDTTFSGVYDVTISGYTQAPDGSYGSFNGTTFTVSPNTISVTFTNGVATANLKLNKASLQTIGISIDGVATPATNTISITPVAGIASSMKLTTDLTAPASNGGMFAQQPVITLLDAYENTSVGDSTTEITVSKKDAGSWTLAGTTTVKAISGVATFTNLETANTASVSGAQLAFDTAGLTPLTSSTVTLPAPAPAQTAAAAAAALTPITGEDNAITLTVKNALGNTDTTFSGAKDVTVSGYTEAPDGSYGSFNGTALSALPNTISVSFTNGVATANLKLNKASAQTIGISIDGVATPATNTISITPVAGIASSMKLTTDLTAPASNGGVFAQQPVITLRDTYGNTSVGDITTVITVSKKDAGSWTLTGTMTATASSGIATFTDLGTANTASVSGAQLAFDTAGLTPLTSSTVTLPAPAPAQTAAAAAAALTPITGEDNAITLTVKNALGNTDTTFSGAKDVTVSGYTEAPDGSYGSFNGTALSALPNTISVSFTNGVATANLKLNKASAQTIGISIDGVATPATNTISITPVAGIASSMKLTTDLIEPASNGGAFAQQPVITLLDAYGNTSVGDSSTVITVSKEDAGSWTLTGTMTATASSGVVTFTDLKAANAASVSGAQLAFDATGLTPLTSSTVTLPAPAPAQTAAAAAAALTPITGEDNAITLTVKDALGNTDTTFNGATDVTISGYTVAPDGSYGSFNGTALTASPNTISVTFTNGAATANLKLNKASAQTIGISIAGVATPAANTLSITPAAGIASSMKLTTDLTAPASNGGVFAQQPVITLLDAYGNTSVGDSSTVITVSKKDAGSWTLTGTTSVTASSGVATFTGLKAANAANVNGAQLAFDATGLTPLTSSTVTLPAPAPVYTGQPTTSVTTNVDVLVNGKVESAGTATTTKVHDQTVTTVTIDENKLEDRLATAGQHAVITIPVLIKSDVVVWDLNGRMVNNMDQKQSILEIKTENASYTIPAQQIDMNAILKQLGKSVALQDIKVQFEIAAPTAESMKIVENSAVKGHFTIVAPPINFTVKVSYGDITIELSKFKAYMERTIAIPEGVDPNKITTGIVVEPDGTVRHVPTRIITNDGKYYAKVKSLTNSTYAIVWHPIAFKDVAQHWSKDAVNDMGSRMIISGIGSDNFNPDQDITRAEFAAIMVRGLGLKLEDGAAPFSDVKSSEWYSSAIQTAYSYNLISGFEDGTFRPMDKITREQAMTIIAKAMKITGLKAKLQSKPLDELLGAFTDAKNVSEWAKISIADCLQAGVVTGRNSTELAPQAYISRAEVATIIQRLLKKSELI